MKQQTNNSSASLEQLTDGEFKITGDLDFQTVPVIWQKSIALFAKCASIHVDLSGVNRSDSAGLALLIEWMRYARTRDISISFHHLPIQMHEIAKVCEVDKNLPI